MVYLHASTDKVHRQIKGKNIILKKIIKTNKPQNKQHHPLFHIYVHSSRRVTAFSNPYTTQDIDLSQTGRRHLFQSILPQSASFFMQSITQHTHAEATINSFSLLVLSSPCHQNILSASGCRLLNSRLATPKPRFKGFFIFFFKHKALIDIYQFKHESTPVNLHNPKIHRIVNINRL